MLKYLFTYLSIIKLFLPSCEEQPGPPVNKITKGSFEGSDLI